MVENGKRVQTYMSNSLYQKFKLAANEVARTDSNFIKFVFDGLLSGECVMISREDVCEECLDKRMKI